MDPSSAKAEIEREPFRPFRIYFVSGKTLDVRHSGQAWMLMNVILVLQESRDRKRTGLYDILPIQNIERIEQLPL